MEFERMKKIPRMGNKRDQMIITEKIDGTNAQVMIDEDHNVTACSKRRVLGLGKQKDNYGFCQWVVDHRDELIDILGPGRHYGEWWGSKIQRGYGLTNGERRFSIFNTRRPADSLREPVGQVPTLYHGPFDTAKIYEAMADLLVTGSRIRPDDEDAWYKPEGIVVCNLPTGQLWKLTYDYKDGKWGAK